MRKNALVALGAGVLGAAALASCRSVRARYVEQPGAREDVGGMPIVVERPRWIKVTTKTVLYAIAKRTVTTDGKNPAPLTETWSYDLLPPQSEVSTEVVSVGEMYALDVDRPFAGKANYEFVFPDGKQYPNKVKGEIEDKTVDSVVAGLDKLLPYVTKKKDAAEPQAGNLTFPEPGFTTVKVSDRVDRIDFYDLCDPRRLVFSYCPTGCTVPPGVPAVRGVHVPVGPLPPGK